MVEKVEEKGVGVKAPVKAKAVGLNSDFPWAFNKTKLKQSIQRVVDAAKADRSIQVTEEAVKEDYLEHAGLLTEEAAENLLKKRPRSTSNVRE